MNDTLVGIVKEESETHLKKAYSPMAVTFLVIPI